MKKPALMALAACCALAVAVPSASAAPNFYLGTPSYGGTGCPAGSVRATMSPDKTTMSVLFDKYVAMAGSPTGLTLDRKTCNVAIPVHIPQGFSLTTYKIDYRGFNDVPRGAYTRFMAEYFFAGARGPTSSRVFNGPLVNDFLATDNIAAASLVWSACGADTNLRANTSAIASTNSFRQQTMASVDSADIQGGLRYYLQWRTC